MPNDPATAARFAPQDSGFFDLARLSAVTRQQSPAGLGNLSELAFKSFSDASMKRASRLTQKGAVGRVLYESVFEEIGRVRRHTLPEKQACSHETVER